MIRVCSDCVVNNVYTYTDFYKYVFGISEKKQPTQKELDKKNKIENDKYRSMIKDVIFNKKKNATTVQWSDGTFTVVKLSPNDKNDPYYAIAMCMAKKLCGNRSVANEIVEKWGDKYFEDEEEPPAPKSEKKKKKGQ